jgi:hypothetical protein
MIFVEEIQKLIAGPRWWPDTRREWPTDRRFKTTLTRDEDHTHLTASAAVYCDVARCPLLYTYLRFDISGASVFGLLPSG